MAMKKSAKKSAGRPVAQKAGAKKAAPRMARARPTATGSASPTIKNN